MRFEKTATRLWKRLSREERLAAASAFWRETPQEVAGAALAAIVQARHLRPQVARSLGEEEKASSLASVLDPGETVASALLVAPRDSPSPVRTHQNAIGHCSGVTPWGHRRTR